MVISGAAELEDPDDLRPPRNPSWGALFFVLVSYCAVIVPPGSKPRP